MKWTDVTTINKRCAGLCVLSLAMALMWWATGSAPATAEVRDFTPEGIQKYLDEHPDVDTAAKFLHDLGEVFGYNWIMMTNTESVQTGTAESPRFIAPDPTATRVFGFALDSQIVEYLHFEAATAVDSNGNLKCTFNEATGEYDPVPDCSPLYKFRFHTIDVPGRKVIRNDPECLSCHASSTAHRGPRPNWDAYDSWGGALPFNRDRIYENSEEETAFKRILNTDHDLIKQLAAPPGFIQVPPGNGLWTIDWAQCDLVPPAQWCKNDPVTGTVAVTYALAPGGNVVYPGPLGPIDVPQGGRYLRVTHSPMPRDDDEGRAVALFDLFTRHNALRVAQELVEFPTKPDIRPVALAIASGCDVENNLDNYAHENVLKQLRTYHNVASFQALRDDTQTKMESLPQKKANLQARNLKDLIVADGGTATPDAITREVARRSQQTFALDKLTGFMIDREVYDKITTKIALFRFFLEPVGVAVDTWSMSVKSTTSGATRNKTYTFGDLFESVYLPKLQTKLQAALGLTTFACSDLEDLSRKALRGNLKVTKK